MRDESNSPAPSDLDELLFIPELLFRTSCGFVGWPEIIYSVTRVLQEAAGVCWKHGKEKKKGGSDSLLDVNAEMQDVTEMKRSCKMSSAQSLVFKLRQALDVSE